MKSQQADYESITPKNVNDADYTRILVSNFSIGFPTEMVLQVCVLKLGRLQRVSLDISKVIIDKTRYLTSRLHWFSD